MAISSIQNVTPSNVPQQLQGMDFHTMMMALVFERAETLDNVARGQMGDMAQKNERMKLLNNSLQTARTAGATDVKDQQALTGQDAVDVYKTLEAEGIPIPDGMKVYPEGDAAAAAELQDILNLVDGRAGLGGYRGDIWWRAPDIIKVAEKYNIDLGDINIKTWSSGQQYLGPSDLKNEAAWEALETKLSAKIAEVSAPHISGTTDQWKTLIENVKTQIDSLSQDSQLDMLKLQGLIQKLNQTIEMGSNETAKHGQTSSTVIGNMAR